MADAATLPVSPDVVALVRARAQETNRDPQAVADEILRSALEPNYFRDDAHREAFNRELKRRLDGHLAGGAFVTAKESLASIGVDFDDADE